MKKFVSALVVFVFVFTSCAQQSQVEDTPFSLDDFLTENKALDLKVDSVMKTLDQKAMVAQLIMPAAGRLGESEERINYLVENRLVGGLILLNGTKEQFTNWVKVYEAMNASNGNLPFLYSADAEPSLVNRKITGSTPVSKATEIHSAEEARAVARIISNDLNEIGINYNFAPVVDLSPNKTVGYRGFGSDPNNIIPFSAAFIEQTQQQNIIATAKHFPGHGLVSGDTHKSLQVIDGELKELKYYPELIEKGLLSIMVAHIAVKNNPTFNTNGLPATTSEVIVQKLLRDSLGFKGLVITDAMGMGGVASIPNASVLAISAGCDILLMPKDAEQAHKEISAACDKNPEFKKKVVTAAERIVRMKICLGLIK